MEEHYIYQGAKKLRCGYTTGTCAAAAVRAAAEMLLTGAPVQTVTLSTPKGVRLTLSTVDCRISGESAACAVVKDSGDDPDVTNGMKICAEVYRCDTGVEITGGEGIGVVTRPGLDQPVGAHAINSVPRKMIALAAAEAAEYCEYKGGFRIVISVPGGAEIASKTFNPRMGIEGGISIIGTTGIVEPMSNSAIVETIRTEANMRRAAGNRYLALSVGNYSDQFIRANAPYMEEHCVTCSNFIGDAIDIGVSLGFDGILLIGHIGKLVKLGSGIMNTHSSAADGRMETLIACGALAGVDSGVLRLLTDCVTADAALDILYDNGAAEDTLKVLTGRIDRYLSARAKGGAETGALIFSYKNDLLLKTPAADSLIRSISEEEGKG